MKKNDFQRLENTIESAIRSKSIVEITYQSGSRKISVQRGIVKDRFFKDGQQLILLETGLDLMFNEIIAIEFSNQE